MGGRIRRLPSRLARAGCTRCRRLGWTPRSARAPGLAAPGARGDRTWGDPGLRRPGCPPPQPPMASPRSTSLASAPMLSIDPLETPHSAPTADPFVLLVDDHAPSLRQLQDVVT